MWTARDPDRFIVGVNLPWVGYGTDFGSSAWFPLGGLSRQAGALERFDRTLARIAADGITTIRMFLLCDVRSGVRWDGEGIPAGLDDSVLPDLDAMLSVARGHRVGVIAVLLDFHLCDPATMIDGVQLGGRSYLIVHERARTAFIDRVLSPIVERCADDPGVVAWDVINEPEWCLPRGLLPRPAAVPFDALQRFLLEAVERIRVLAPQPVTIGSAGTWRLNLVRPLGLDFYQVHWYERFGWSMLTRPVADLDLGDRPVILGEFSGRAGRVAEVLDAARTAGYEGALVWSALAEDDQSAYPPQLVEWLRGHP